jgi:ubiquinone/menaquinone biosynthesis C-methylase UbiE
MASLPRDASILDIACGDGVGLRHFKELGFTSVVGAEFEPTKLRIAAKTGFRTVLADFHSLSAFNDSEFDVVYSSHSLEHALYPDKVLSEFGRVCRKGGFLFLVLPYPDKGNIKAHCGKFLLGTDRDDNGVRLTKYVQNRGFKLIEIKFDSFREPEIWAKFERIL